MMARNLIATLLILPLILAGVLAEESDRAGLEVGVLPETWPSGGPGCVGMPDWHAHAYNTDFYIVRQSGCVHPEKPFLYLIFGNDRALLLDTGAPAPGTAAFILNLVERWTRERNRPTPPLLVIHSHAHGDHTGGDDQFRTLPGVDFVEPTAEAIQRAASITNWPVDIGQIDLGGRILDVIPIPGHESSSIALYDRVTGNMMTGDSLYPGRLYVAPGQTGTYAASVERLINFVRQRPVAHVLGAHIEQTDRPYFDYPADTAYQPAEHVLELDRAHVFELREAFRTLEGSGGQTLRYPEFSLVPIGSRREAARGGQLEPGRAPGAWMSGGPNCLTVPDWQVHAYNEDFYILRQSGCIDAEKPFLFLIFGEERALLEDTGVARRMPEPGEERVVPTAPVIMELIARWAKLKGRAPVPLTVIHSHAHGDHTAADAQFEAMPDVQYIAPTPAAIQEATGIGAWPNEIGRIDLGNRIVDVIPIPGHNEASIALYDRRTGNLLTGDSLYPGLLSVVQADLAAFTASARRLAEFVRVRPVAHVFGTHIEQKWSPYQDYGRGIRYQPDEALLALKRAHVFEWEDAFVSMDGQLELFAAPDFTIVPRGAATAFPDTAGPAGP